MRRNLAGIQTEKWKIQKDEKDLAKHVKKWFKKIKEFKEKKVDKYIKKINSKIDKLTKLQVRAKDLNELNDLDYKFPKIANKIAEMCNILSVNLLKMNREDDALNLLNKAE